MRFIILLSFCVFLNAAYMKELKWPKGETFLSFLEKKQIPLKLYYDLQREDKELVTEIVADINYQELLSDEEELQQVLIPIGDEIQAHIYKKNNEYVFEIIPIEYQKSKHYLALKIQNSPSVDIYNSTKNALLANEFGLVFQKSVDFTSLRKDDNLVIHFEQRMRLGKQFLTPKIFAAMIEMRKKGNFVFLYDKDKYFNEDGKQMQSYFLTVPLKYTRISSKFTQKRWHPILKRYRAHLGIDYAAPIGTIVRAAGDGTIRYVGKKGGYGKTIEIYHSDGYKTLYAHLNGYKKGIKKGKKVKRNAIIGYVGNTGMSTGPHLHFGLYKNNKAINPASIVKIAKGKLRGNKLKDFKKLVSGYKTKFENIIKNPPKIQKLQNFEYQQKLSKKEEIW